MSRNRIFLIALGIYSLFFSYVLFREALAYQKSKILESTKTILNVSTRRSLSLQRYNPVGTERLIQLLTLYSDNWEFNSAQISPHLKVFPFVRQPSPIDREKQTELKNSTVNKAITYLESVLDPSLSKIAEVNLRDIGQRSILLEDSSIHFLSGNFTMNLLQSSIQVLPLLNIPEDEWIVTLIEGLLQRQQFLILQNPYASSFRLSNERVGESTFAVEKMEYSPDHLSSFLFLSYKWWKASNRTRIFTSVFPF